MLKGQRNRRYDWSQWGFFHEASWGYNEVGMEIIRSFGELTAQSETKTTADSAWGPWWWWWWWWWWWCVCVCVCVCVFVCVFVCACICARESVNIVSILYFQRWQNALAV